MNRRFPNQPTPAIKAPRARSAPQGPATKRRRTSLLPGKPAKPGKPGRSS